MPGETFEEFDLGTAMDSVAEGLNTPATDPAPSPTDPAAAPAPAPAPVRGYPQSWGKEHEFLWNTLPETHTAFKDMVHKREEDFLKGIGQYKEHATAGERYNKVLSNYQQTFQQHGLAPEQVDQMVGGILQAQMTLALGTPEEKHALIKSLINDYKIDPKTLIEQSGNVDPALQALQQKITVLESNLRQREQIELAAQREQANREVKAFADANPDFTLVAAEIEQLLKVDPKMTLQDAYDKAIWLNAATREKAIAAQAKAAADAKAEEERKRAEKAAAASKGSVQTTQRAANSAPPKGSMDETMAETLAAIKTRS